MAALAVYVRDLNWLGSKWLLRQQQFKVYVFEKLRALASVLDVIMYNSRHIAPPAIDTKQLDTAPQKAD